MPKHMSMNPGQSQYRQWSFAKAHVGLLLSWITFAVILFITMLPVRRIGGDDVNFANELQTSTIIQWVSERYQTWSSRLFSDMMTGLVLPLDPVIWRFANTGMGLLLLYALVRLVWGKVDLFGSWFVFICYWLIAPGVLVDGVYWTVGSFNYLWPTAIGLFSAILFRDSYTESHNHWWPVYLICSFCAALGVEQVAACLFAMSLVVLVLVWLENHRIDWHIIGYTLVVGIGILIALLSPGTATRQVEEIARWYPEYASLSLLSKVARGILWQFSYSAKYLIALLVVSSLTIVVFSLLTTCNKLQVVSSINMSCLLVICMSCNVNDIHNVIFSFPNINAVELARWCIPYAFWSVYLITTFVGLICICKKHVISAFLLMGSITSAALMYFSPTIYASGPRSMFVPSIMLILALLMAIKEVSKTSVSMKCIFVPVACISATMMLYLMLSIASQGFSPHSFW